jgi:hypothetical protein
MAVEQKVGIEAVDLFKALKQLRVRLDQRSEEILAFDAYQAQIRARGRRKATQEGVRDDPEENRHRSSARPARGR